jgi:DNA polymerase I-like protein with 3'-5' exonuclease and polymerase domains
VVLPPTGKDITDFKSVNGDLRKWVQELVDKAAQGESITVRPLPQFKSLFITDAAAAETIIRHIRAENLAMAMALHTTAIEGEARDPALAKPCLMALANREEVFVFDLSRIPCTALAGLNGYDRIVLHNGAWQMAVLRASGIHLKGCGCTMLQHSALKNSCLSFQALTQLYAGYNGERYNPDYTKDQPSQAEYKGVALDAFATAQLYSEQKIRLEHFKQDHLYNLMAKAQPAVAEMMLTGMHVDWAAHQAFCQELEKVLQGNLENDTESSGSLKSLASTWGHPFTRFRSPVDQRIHPAFLIAEAVTGRMSCKTPALQAAPKNPLLRKVFTAPEGRLLVGADFSQMEFRVAAAMTGDEAMQTAFREGLDLHRQTAAIEHGIAYEAVTDEMRNAAKALNFRFLYGGNPTLHPQAYNAYASALPQLQAWSQTQEAFAGIHANRLITTPSGRRITKKMAAENWRSACLNYPIQGSAADVLYAALGRLPELLEGLDARIVNCVHDEIILEVAEPDVPAAKEALEQAMVQGFLALFPEAPTNGLVTASAGRNWAELK